MAVPSKMSTRRFSRALRLRLRIAHASAWESLVATHTGQALQFIHEFGQQVSVLDALDLYFRVVPVPSHMEEAIRTRALSGLELALLPPPPPPPPPVPADLPGARNVWTRLGRMVARLAARRRHRARIVRQARAAAARAANEILATHVTNVLNLAYLLAGRLSIERAVTHYVREFGVALPDAGWIRRRVEAEAASTHLAERVLTHAPAGFAGLMVGYPAPDG